MSSPSLLYKVSSERGNDYFVRAVDNGITLSQATKGQPESVLERFDANAEGVALGIYLACFRSGLKRYEAYSEKASQIADKIMEAGILQSVRSDDTPADIVFDADGRETKIQGWKPGPKIDHDNILTIRAGDLWGPKGHICGGEQLFGLLVDFDLEAPMLMKYGGYKPVASYAHAFWGGLGRMALDETSIELLALPVHPDIIEELNCCIACSGRIGQFKGFLADFQVKHPEVTLKPYQVMELNEAQPPPRSGQRSPEP